jgi:hypothetical protein
MEKMKCREYVSSGCKKVYLTSPRICDNVRADAKILSRKILWHTFAIFSGSVKIFFAVKLLKKKP